MEIEAKFALPDAEVYRRLQEADCLDGFALSAGKVKHVRDIYLDTANRAILAAGYSCRRREQKDTLLITLKRLEKAEEAIHRREELEVLLPTDLPPEQWHDSEVRERVMQLIGQSPLSALFELHQIRVIRLVKQKERLVAELSLDEVHLNVGGIERVYYELEVELTPQGTEDDLSMVVTHLQSEWGLSPQPLSKFWRALNLMDEQDID